MQSPSQIKRRLLRLMSAHTAKYPLLRGVSSVEDQIATMKRVYPGRKIVVLPQRLEFSLSKRGAGPWVRVVPARVQLAKPRYVLNDLAVATMTVQTFGLDGSSSTSWPTWCLSSGTWHEKHTEAYWRTKGVTRTTVHRKIPALVSPGDGWVLVKPAVGTVFRDEFARLYVVAKLGRATELLQVRGEFDAMYRHLNIVSATVTAGARVKAPRGALEFVGVVNPEQVVALRQVANTGKLYGSGREHSS